MIRLLPVFLLAASLCGGGTGCPLRIATWNVQNYLSQNRFEDGTFRLDHPLPENRKQGIRRLLLQTRPDILFLQEIGTRDHLRELQLDLAASGLHYPYTFFSAAPGARTGLAVLALSSPLEVIFHDPVRLDDFGFPGHSLQRGIQETRFSLEGRPYRFFHLHLKSRFSNDPADPDALRLRSAEMKALVRFMDALLASDPVSAFVLAGDFNTPFGDPLWQGILDRWQPLPVADEHHQTWTYQHRSGATDILDGFWFPSDRPTPLLPEALLPASNPPSDHRLVLVRTAG